ncbi:MAG: hypothetical protein WA705_23145 [Candidatus Ozemobacteraceae bacterium]
MIRIWGDFNSRDEEDRIRLNTVGSLEDLDKYPKQIRGGLRIIVFDDDFEVDGILEFSEGIWKAKLLLDTGKTVS